MILGADMGLYNVPQCVRGVRYLASDYFEIQPNAAETPLVVSDMSL